MDNKAWDKPKLQEWKKFWESEMGQEALAKMLHIKDLCLTHALEQTDPDAVAFFVGRAGGVDLVLQDIQAGINALNGKEDKTKE